MDVFGLMATPAVLLLANAMLVLSTIHRLQSVLTRVQESETALLALPADAFEQRADLGRELAAHGRRVHLAHKALLFFYAAAAVFLVLILALGASGLGIRSQAVALPAAFAGAGLLLAGAGLLAAETWVGVEAIDGRVKRLIRHCMVEPPGPPS